MHKIKTSHACTVVQGKLLKAMKRVKGKGHFSRPRRGRTNQPIYVNLARLIILWIPLSLPLLVLIGWKGLSGQWGDIYAYAWFLTFIFSSNPYIYQKSRSDFCVWYVKRRCSRAYLCSDIIKFFQPSFRGSFTPKRTPFSQNRDCLHAACPLKCTFRPNRLT
jgi:hypothetical protein